MKRTARKGLINFSLFFTALLLVLFLNRDRPSTTKAFAWSKIRYRSSFTLLPTAHGKCPGLAETLKPALVVSRVEADGDPTWLENLADKYHVCIYNVEVPALKVEEALPQPQPQYLHVPANRGHEAMAYLTFIIDNYDDLPASGAVFVHGARWSWHNDAFDYDNEALLRDLNVSAALESSNYHNLRCDWSAGTCGESALPGQQSNKILPQGSLEMRMTARLEPWNKRAVSDASLPAVFGTLFGGGRDDSPSNVYLGRSDILRAQCCAQFAVARRGIRQHSREEYVDIRQWLLHEDSAMYDDLVAGRILSYLWHVLFLPDLASSATVDLASLNSLACPDAQTCYCKLYGRCDLDCAHPGHCQGQYTVPKDYKVPTWVGVHT